MAIYIYIIYIKVCSGPSGFVVNISRYFGFSKVVDLAESFKMS